MKIWPKDSIANQSQLIDSMLQIHGQEMSGFEAPNWPSRHLKFINPNFRKPTV